MSRIIPGRTDHVCVRHYKMLTKAGPPRQKHARAVRQRSGRFIAWEKVNLPQLTAAPEVDTLQNEGAAASTPAGMGRKAHGVSKAKRAKRKARASSSGEEQEPESDGIGKHAHPPDPGGEAVDARHCENVGFERGECSHKEPALGPSRRNLRREHAEDSHAEGAAGAGDTASARDSSSGRRRQASTLSQGNCIRLSRAGLGGDEGTIAEDTLAQKYEPQCSIGMMSLVETRRSSRKQRVGRL